MRITRVAPGLLLAVASSHGVTTARAQAPAAAPAFDVVSIKPSPPQTGQTFRLNVLTQRPDGGVTIAQTSVALLITRAYPGANVADMVGLPAWASREFYDISATASMSSPTNDDRAAMMRAMLADRFRLERFQGRSDDRHAGVDAAQPGRARRGQQDRPEGDVSRGAHLRLRVDAQRARQRASV